MADPTHFFLTSTTDTIGGVGGTFATKSGVKNIVLRMAAGNDSVTLAASPAIKLAGNLTVDGGDGANSVSATNLTVGRSMSIKNGTNAAGSDSTYLTNLNVGGGLTVANGDGATNTLVQRNSAGVSTIQGSVSITNGTGQDSNYLSDLNIGGNMRVRNGPAAASGFGGTTQLYNSYNQSARSAVKGSITVSYVGTTGGTTDAVVDADVGGNVAFSYGTGGGTLYLDGFQTAVPAVVRGSVSVTGAGALSVLVGAVGARAGAVVGKNFTVVGGSAADSMSLNRLTVNGATRLSLGDGNNTVAIDDSLFAGAFNLTTGAGTDTVRLDTAAGTTTATTFNKAVKISLGAGVDSVTFGGNTDANQALVFAGGCVVHHGAEGESAVHFGKEQYPFGLGLQWVV
jgi:hypothetical protein